MSRAPKTTHHDFWPSSIEIHGCSPQSLNHPLTTGCTLDTIDIEQLLVHQGWLWLRWRVIGGVQQVSIGTGSQRVSRQQRLTMREFQIVALSARGLMAKEVGAELGIGEATARGTLSRALFKLGLTKGAPLVAVWNALSRPAQVFAWGKHQTTLVFACELAARDGTATLTSSERVILSDLLEGRSNREISEKRGTSERTVANQVAIILRKFRVLTRRELSAKVLGRDE